MLSTQNTIGSHRSWFMLFTGSTFLQLGVYSISCSSKIHSCFLSYFIICFLWADIPAVFLFTRRKPLHFFKLFSGEETNSNHVTYLLAAITSYPEVEERLVYVCPFFAVASIIGGFYQCYKNCLFAWKTSENYRIIEQSDRNVSSKL